MRLPRTFRLALPALGLTGCLAGCVFDTKVAGGAEDFPNTVSLGATTSQSVSDHAEWDQFSNIPKVDIQDADSLVTAPPAKASGGLAKGSAAAGAAPDTTFNLADTAKGFGYRYIRDEGALRVRTDTVVFRWDDQARDSVRGNELLLLNAGAEAWRLTARLAAYRFENTDSAGGFDRALFYERIPKAGGVLAHKLHVVKPGPDGDFAKKADNRPVYYATARTLGSDTLDAFDVSDADGDGQLWGGNGNEGDSGLVNVRHLQTEPVLRPGVVRVAQAMRAVFFKQGARTYPVSFLETRTDRNGRKVTFSVKGQRADSAFGPGDSVTVSVHTVAGPDEETRFVEKANRFAIQLSSAPLQFSQNRLLRFTMAARWREGAFAKGRITATRITFTPDSPMVSGDLTVKGDIRIEAEFADGTTGSAEGRVADKRIQVDLDERKGGVRLRRLRVLWDLAADGQVLEQKPLPD